MTEGSEQASPSHFYEDKELQVLTKRETFAAMAMQGYISSGSVNKEIADWSVQFADELIASLNK
jgi:hypothetical protein